jgi:hypothetical protein
MKCTHLAIVEDNKQKDANDAKKCAHIRSASKSPVLEELAMMKAPEIIGSYTLDAHDAIVYAMRQFKLGCGYTITMSNHPDGLNGIGHLSCHNVGNHVYTTDLPHTVVKIVMSNGYIYTHSETWWSNTPESFDDDDGIPPL